MNHVKTLIFLAICVLVGLGLGKGYIWLNQSHKRGFEHAGEPALVTGVGDAPATRGFSVPSSGAPALPALLRQWTHQFATSVGLEYVATPADSRSALVQAAKAAHAHGMSLVVLPPTRFNSRNPYGRPLAEIAADAQTAAADYVVISWLDAPADSAYWRKAAADVRQHFSGKIILAALPAALPSITCWDAVDIMGAIGPLPFARRLPHASDDVTLHDIRVECSCVITQLEYLARYKEKKLALLNMNVPAGVSNKLLLPGVSSIMPPRNPGLQSMIYEALLLETKGRGDTTELMLFNWGDPGSADAPNTQPAIMNKITEAWDPKKPKVAETIPAPPDDNDADGM